LHRAVLDHGLPGVVIVFEVAGVDDARRYVEDFPLSKAGYLEWFYLPVQAPLPLESLMDAWVDVAEPYDRTTPHQGATPEASSDGWIGRQFRRHSHDAHKSPTEQLLHSVTLKRTMAMRPLA
jgi:hypothetical protein